MSRLLKDLSYRMRPLAVELLAQCIEAKIPVLIVDTLRTPEEQEQNIAKGVSWTRNSKHLPQPPDGKSLAIDICPYDIFQANGPDKLNWNSADPVWQKIGEIGERIGLKWGVIKDGKRIDLGHFEYKAIQPSGPAKVT